MIINSKPFNSPLGGVYAESFDFAQDKRSEVLGVRSGQAPTLWVKGTCRASVVSTCILRLRIPPSHSLTQSPSQFVGGQVPFIAFRSLSDLAGGGPGENEIKTFFQLAADNSAEVILAFLQVWGER